MFGHWFVVASQSTTRVLTEGPRKGKFRLVEIYENPLAHEKNRALSRHKPSVSVRSVGNGKSARGTSSKKIEPREEAAIQFAKQIAKELDKLRKEKRFESLTIVAEPKFLGKLRSSLSAPTTKRVVEWRGADLGKVPLTQLPTRL